MKRQAPRTELVYQASEWGARFHARNEDEVLGGGAAGPGKSLVLLMDPWIQIHSEHQRCALPNHPYPLKWGQSQGHAIHLRRTSPMLDDTIKRSKQMFPRIYPDAVWRESDLRWQFPTGYQFSFGHCKDPDDWAQYLSREFCVAKGTLVLMGNGSFRPIESVLVGEKVMTLEGPRPVTATYSLGEKACVSARLVDADGTVLGEQVHPEDHPVLTTAGVSHGWSVRGTDASPPGFSRPRTRPAAAWQSYRPAWLERLRSSGCCVALADAEIGYAGSCGAPQEALPQRRLSDPAVLLLPALLLGSLGTAREHLLRARFREARGRQELLDSLGSCSPGSGPCGEPPLGHSESDPASVPPPTGAAGYSHASCTSDAPELSPKRTHDYRGTYFHRYTMWERQGFGEIGCISVEFEPCGLVPVCDLTVAGANHYITSVGLVNSNTHISMDEAWQFTEEQADQIGARLRCTDPVLAGDPDLGLPSMLRRRYASNPNAGKDGQIFTMKGNPYWLRDKFVEPDPMGNVVHFQWLTMSDGTKVKKTWLFMPASLWDNPDRNFVRNYEQRLQGMPHHIRQAYLYGNWYITANSYFADVWNERIHTCERFRVPASWPRCRSMDWGFKMPGCILWGALDDDGNLFIIREYKFQGKTDREVADRVKEIEIEMGVWDKRANRSLIMGPADTQLWEKRGDSAKSKAEVFAEKGIIWTQADKASREGNAQRIYKRMQDHGKETMTPGLVIFRDCKYLIKTLPALQSEEGNPECPQDGGDDHGTDALFYLGAFCSRGRKGIPRIKEKDEWEEEAEDVRKPRGRYGYGSLV